MSIFDEPKVDCHCHLFDPARFPYSAQSSYHPAGQEIATAAQIHQVFSAHGVRNALLVQLNSGYGSDNRCMLDAIAASNRKFKGVAVVEHAISSHDLMKLRDASVVGVAFNLPFHGTSYYLGTQTLLARLADLDMFLQFQFHQHQLLEILPLIKKYPVRLLVDHCGRPDPAAGLCDPAFQALLALGQTGRAAVKLSGYIKFSRQTHPFKDTWPFIQALVEAFTSENCVWGSDWPFLRAGACGLRAAASAFRAIVA